MIRAFLALELDEATRSALVVQQFLLPLPRKEPPENFHITLAFLGEQPERSLEDAHEALMELRQPAFAVRLEGLGLFGGDRPRVAYAAVTQDEPLMRLQRKVETIARRAGIEVEARRFIPHVTLGRFRPPGIEETMRLERAISSSGDFRAGPMSVPEFVMFESIRHAGGSRYEPLARYPLT
ncbi:MAG: RNA 2',3'-cyclic phosphodiesterase [Cereibacter sphaeroides]|uniref:RNA 2',3'-cyclic phosphodiesterase n=1 Tax=Cereibacter sphaeroides TaxID=1063 RepID=A0A2W5S1I5_CERSP|nr:MAG: RNA 2',3'-cyclic phosphodiesterase [Cereibacter sphaeroides]